MNLALPDEWIRKAISEAVNGLVVESETIKCYDYRVTGSKIPKNYVLITTQSNEVDRGNKCGYRWENSTLIEVVTRYTGTLNPGTRLLADRIANSVRNAVKGLTLDVSSGLKIMDLEMSFPNDLPTITDNENVFRKFIRLELTIN